jgi:hypothetical protein
MKLKSEKIDETKRLANMQTARLMRSNDDCKTAFRLSWDSPQIDSEQNQKPKTKNSISSWSWWQQLAKLGN